MGEKWGWVIYGLFVYKMLTGCGENVDFMPINSPYFLCPTKVKQHPDKLCQHEYGQTRTRKQNYTKDETKPSAALR